MRSLSAASWIQIPRVTLPSSFLQRSIMYWSWTWTFSIYSSQCRIKSASPSEIARRQYEGTIQILKSTNTFLVQDDERVKWNGGVSRYVGRAFDVHSFPLGLIREKSVNGGMKCIVKDFKDPGVSGLKSADVQGFTGSNSSGFHGSENSEQKQWLRVGKKFLRDWRTEAVKRGSR